MSGDFVPDSRMTKKVAYNNGMMKKIKDLGDPDLHAKKRDTKSRKKHHLPDNRKSIQLISRLSSTPKHGKKTPKPR